MRPRAMVPESTPIPAMLRRTDPAVLQSVSTPSPRSVSREGNHSSRLIFAIVSLPSFLFLFCEHNVDLVYTEISRACWPGQSSHIRRWRIGLSKFTSKNC